MNELMNRTGYRLAVLAVIAVAAVIGIATMAGWRP